MKQKTKLLEIIGVLSVSLILTTTHSISGALPLFQEQFPQVSRSAMEFMISVPTILMTIMIALSPVFNRILTERAIITGGLLIIGIFGCLPFFLTSFPAIMITRIFLGIGIGLLNAAAVSMVGQRFSGPLRAKLQGMRMSAETLGQTALTLLASFLLLFGWNYPFLIYGAAFLILFLYLAFVPHREKHSAESDYETAEGLPADSKKRYQAADRDNRKAKQKKINRTELFSALFYADFSALLISSEVVLSLRLPTRIVDSGLGSAVTGSTILSISIFGGFLGGLTFGKLLFALKRKMLPLFLGTAALGMAAIALAPNLVLLTLGSILCKFSITSCISYTFNSLSDRTSPASLGTANAIVLVGCNLGSSVAPFLLKLIDVMSSQYFAPFLVYGAVLLCICAGAFCLTLKVSHRSR